MWDEKVCKQNQGFRNRNLIRKSLHAKKTGLKTKLAMKPKTAIIILTILMIVTISLKGTGPVHAASLSVSVGQDPSFPYTVPKLMMAGIPIRESPQSSLRMIPVLNEITLP